MAWIAGAVVILAHSAVLAAEARAGSLTPLTPAEQAAVMGEIEAMVRTDETQVKHFVVREATRGSLAVAVRADGRAG